MQLELDLARKRAAALFLAPSPDAAWQGTLSSWFAHVASHAWQDESPAIVVVPTRAHANALKERLLAEKHALLGVQFVTPPYLRAFFCEDDVAPSPQHEDLQLLLAIAAEEQLQQSALSEAERLAATSVRRTPGHLLRLLEHLSAAGAEFDELDLPAFRHLVQRFRAHLARANLTTLADADQAAFARVAAKPPLFRDVLITGFHGGHWRLWHLLRAALNASQRSTVLLQNPRIECEDLDAAWIGSWEQAFGEATPLHSDEPNGHQRELLFLAGIDTREQAEAIVAAAHRFLSEASCSRLGIVFPVAGALSRLVAAAFTRQGVPHYDAMGQLAPGIFETPLFQSWVELQRTPRLAALLRFLTALESDHPLFEKVSRQTIADALHKALGSLAIDDLTVLVTSLRGRGGKGELICAALDRVCFLPVRATFAEFLDATRNAFERLGWNERWGAIEQHTAWTRGVASSFSRMLYLRWLEETAIDFRVTRDAGGAHAYARVHLLPPAQAEDQTWSHLILTSLNDRVWPAAFGGDFLPAPQVEALNQSTRQLNRAATRRGRQGEGHVAVREGRALFLGAPQQRQLVEAQFASLIENTRIGVAFTASVLQEDAPERISNPSEFLNKAYHEAHGHSLSQQQMRALRATTRAWLDRAPLDPQADCADTPSIRQTRLAYRARRAIAPSDEYDFALRTPPKEIEPLSVSELEEMLKAPAIVWLRRYLGVEGEEDSVYAWNATIGKWTHDWLANLSAQPDAFVAFPTLDQIENRIRAAAERKRLEVEQLCRQAGKHLPDWWESGWQGALCVAHTLGRVLSTAKDWPWLAAEWRLEAQPIGLDEDRHLLLRGRADLLLGKTASAPSSLEIPELWIIDFKTGNKDALDKALGEGEQRLEKVRRKLLKADALQLGLYAQAARQLGAGSVCVSLLSPNLAAAAPQLLLEDFRDCLEALRELARMQSSGVFGFKGPLRSAYSFTRPYPLATLAIDSEIVDERWEKTHPDLALESSYWR